MICRSKIVRKVAIYAEKRELRILNIRQAMNDQPKTHQISTKIRTAPIVPY